ncbi:MAG: hypothetical protein IKS74_05895 [Methanomicrobium sp.]|nr:hypothetical protein [Methanomicrobium sp.]
MKSDFIFTDCKGSKLTKEDINGMDAGELIRVYTQVKDRTVRLGTYSRSDLMIKFG